MHHTKKPEPLIDATPLKKCPVCGHRSYSATGVHPQCSVQLADEPRRLQLAADKRAKALLESAQSGK